MKLKKLLDDIEYGLKNDFEYDCDSVLTEVETENGLVEVYLYSDDSCEVNVWSNKHPEREYPNLTQFIEESIPGWDDIYEEPSDIWNDHGFRDEADYLHWRYGY